MLHFLESLFSSAARVRHVGRHFRRTPILEPLGPGSDPAATADAVRRAGSTLQEDAFVPLDLLYARLESTAHGLPVERAGLLRLALGPNEVGKERPLAWHTHLWRAYRNPFNLLLTLLAAVSWVTDVRLAAPDDRDWSSVIVIGGMVMVATLLRYVQERRSHAAADALRAMVQNTATVLRPGAGRKVEVPLRELVPGDVVALSAGDMVPADCRVVAAKDLFVAQAALTGEALPVEKFMHAQRGRGNPLELENIVFMGTNVVSGAGLALVLGTGSRTCFGQLAGSVSALSRAPTQFQQGINRVSGVLIRFMLVMVPVVFLISGAARHDWLQALLFALAVAVGLTPEMLPMIVTSTLAKGALAMSRRRVVVKRLDAIQDLGAMTVLCTDKTGTLTQDRIVLERHVDVAGVASDEVLGYAYLNSHYQTGLRNLLDVAVLEHTGLARSLDPASNYVKVDEIPFDFARRRMSVVVSPRGASAGGHVLICKGALEEMLAACDQVRGADGDQPLDAARKERIRQETGEMNAQGLRVIAVAVRRLSADHGPYAVADEAGLTLIGYIAFLDPPKASTAPALRALRDAGVSIKVLTGDMDRVARKVCHDVGLAVDHAYVGADLDAMDDAALGVAVRRGTLFARLTPAHKARIVRALREQGATVGFMGDGINDAPALRAADVGISVDTAVDISKEAADIILLEKSLMVLHEGVLEGRRIFSNMLKYLKMTASSNFGNVFSVLIASAFLPFLPMLPAQLLIQNLMYDFSQIAIPFDRADPESLRRPQQWDPAGLGRFMVCFGPISSIFDVATFAVMGLVFHAGTPAGQSLFQSGWFVEGLLSQTLVVHLIRTRRVPFLQSRASTPLMVSTGLVMALGVALPMSPLAPAFGMQALPPGYFPWLLLILLGYACLVQAVKGAWVRRYGWQ
ncbi:magnesium-translocating P-type ATPase [Bordetella genomosp. 13]|uniref:magnesium-translocating P-type ATPase n=1 Tax=Bordetella genomosp. 13 TaxID=463040 RepID=UPI0011A5DB95|nr:magnesium-translocating P-type ATPase [Bordetella genomosp. 13]